MSAAILLSIRPEWIDKILSGEKTIEVRKSRPRLDTPFKCYIYCTKPKFEHEDFFVIEVGRSDERKILLEEDELDLTDEEIKCLFIELAGGISYKELMEG